MEGSTQQYPAVVCWTFSYLLVVMITSLLAVLLTRGVLAMLRSIVQHAQYFDSLVPSGT